MLSTAYNKKRIIIGISGASGVIMGVELLRELKNRADMETHLVMTHGAINTLRLETDLSADYVGGLADFRYDAGDLAADIASGSFETCGMIIMPCSMKSVAGIACGYSDNLLLRAADVCLKEKRKLILVPRESPLSAIHLKNLRAAAKAGAIIAPPMLTFYNHADTIEKQIQHIIGKALMQFNITTDSFTPWHNGE